MTGLWLMLGLALAGPHGFRHDGSAVVPDVRPPVFWDVTAFDEGLVGGRLARRCWSTPLEAPTNSTPVIVGDRVFTMVEPTQLVAVDRSTGAVLWSRSNGALDALTGAERAAAEQQLAGAIAAETRLIEVQRTYSALQRDVRRSHGEVSGDGLEAMATEMTALREEIGGARLLRTATTKSFIGYTSPTPVTDGASIWTLVGQGVLSRFTLDGERQWSRWLGPPVEPMRGYDDGHASSPWLADGVLVVPYGRLRGLDPVTGEQRWEGEVWPHYGNPAFGTVGGTSLAVSPSGAIVRVRDGRVLGQLPDSLTYIGPLMVGDVVYTFGNDDDPEKGGKRLVATAHRLAVKGDVASVTHIWDASMPAGHRFYSPPIAVGDRLYVVSRRAVLWVVDRTTGAIVSEQEMGSVFRGADMYASPTVAGGHLFLTGATGVSVVVSLEDPAAPQHVATNTLEPMHAGPAFVGDRLYLRTLAGLWCVEPPG